MTTAPEQVAAATEAAATVAGNVAADITAGVVASAEQAVASAEARAETAEAVRDAVVESAMRDELCDRIDDAIEDFDTWRQEQNGRLANLESRQSAMEATLTEIRATPPTVAVITPAPAADPSLTSEALPVETTPAAVVISPEGASPAPIVAVPVAAARRKGRFL